MQYHLVLLEPLTKKDKISIISLLQDVENKSPYSHTSSKYTEIALPKEKRLRRRFVHVLLSLSNKLHCTKPFLVKKLVQDNYRFLN